MEYLLNKIIEFVGGILKTALFYIEMPDMVMPEIPIDLEIKNTEKPKEIKQITDAVGSINKIRTIPPKLAPIFITGYYNLTIDILKNISINKINIDEFTHLIDDVKKPDFLLTKTQLEQIIKIDKKIANLKTLITQAEKKYDRSGSSYYVEQVKVLQRARRAILKSGRDLKKQHLKI